MTLCRVALCHRLKDIIYGFGTNNVYLVLECMDCDLRDLLDVQQPLELWRIKVHWWHPRSFTMGVQLCTSPLCCPLRQPCPPCSMTEHPARRNTPCMLPAAVLSAPDPGCRAPRTHALRDAP